jgi:hypothetical protein
MLERKIVPLPGHALWTYGRAPGFQSDYEKMRENNQKILEYKGYNLSGQSNSSSPKPRFSQKNESGNKVISEMIKINSQRTKESINALTAVQLSGMVMGLRPDGSENDGGKKIKGVEITTTSEEEVLQDKENLGKVVSMTNRRVEFIEAPISGSLPSSNENAPAPDWNSLVRMNFSIIAELRQWS